MSALATATIEAMASRGDAERSTANAILNLLEWAMPEPFRAILTIHLIN